MQIKIRKKLLDIWYLKDLKMQSYVNLVKGLVQTGQQYLNQIRPDSKQDPIKI